MNNKLYFGLVAGVLVSVAAFAAPNDTVVSFSTKGVDRYADGSKVLDGESYALVWTKDGATFGGLSAACKTLAPTDKLVLVAPLAKGGKCPVTVLEIDAASASAYEGGSFALYLLDTRVSENGKIAPAKYRDNVPYVVNALGSAATKESSVASASGVAGGITALSSVKLGDVGVFTQIDAPAITAIRIEGATVHLEVKGMSPAADYFVLPGDTPGKFASALDAKAEEEGFTFEKPAEATFFKVIGVRKFGAPQ